MRLGVRAALVDGEMVPGEVVVEEGVIRAVGAGPAGASGIAVPGFVDLQVNGFGGVDFLAADVEGYRQARRALARSGVTSFQPTLISSPTASLRQALRDAAKAQGDGGVRILGVHLEGPFLAPRWKGAHDERHLLPPDSDLAERMCGWGPVTYMTIAPEQPGGMDLLARLVAGGITVSLGHTDADAPAAHATTSAPGPSPTSTTPSDASAGVIRASPAWPSAGPTWWSR
jgi:N-acetylglucosamine-6-phosphate deacetylase